MNSHKTETAGTQNSQTGPHLPRFHHLGSGERWFVIRIQPHAESRAIAHIARQGFRCFCPMIRKTIRHARTIRQISVPLFPGYVFVALNLARDRWRSINGTAGVVQLLTNSERPLPVPVGVVENLQSALDPHRIVPPTVNLKPGESVRVLHGPFADQIGTLERLDSAGRVKVLLNFLGQPVPVVLSAQLLAPAA